MNENISILVTDDDPDILFATARLLRSAGYTVWEAATGEACFETVLEKKPDLVLLDVLLPDVDGYTLCRRIKGNENLRGTYVILLSGKKTASEDQSTGLELGADGYLARPIENRELLARVQAMSRIIKAEQERDRLIEELRKVIAEIKTLRSLLPICSSCKKIRNDDGYWQQIEAYISEHSDTRFSHGICPECLQKLYGDFAAEMSP